MVPENTCNGPDLADSLWSMALREEGSRIDQIPTNWTAVELMSEDQSARHRLLLRYYGAVYRYLRSVLRDPDAAGDLAQEFSQHFLRGKFDRADRRRGRFRDYVKTAAHNLSADHYRRQPPAGGQLGDAPEPAAPDETARDDRLFLECWRDQLLTRAWDELARLQDRTAQPFHTVLRFRADHPDLHSPQMAEQLSSVMGKPVTAGWVRQVLLRARRKFADLLLEDLAHSLEWPTTELMEQELIDLDLREHCRDAFDEWRRHHLQDGSSAKRVGNFGRFFRFPATCT
jgi:DNA-directed RNA polymerase specialized sigma24 family protein